MRPAAVLLAALAACAPRPAVVSPHAPAGPPRVERVALAAARFQVLWWPGDEAAVRQVAAALPAAAARAARFAPLAAPVTITVHPTHAALEAAVGREGYAWLHAWARYASVDLQSPSTWGRGGAARATDADVEALLAHELAHCATYQRAGTEWGWAYQRIPLWFREGLASAVSGGDAEAADVARLARFYRAEARAGPAARDPLRAPEALQRTHWQEVYGAAHHAFAHLVARGGEAKVAALLDAMGRERLPFPEAFERVMGIREEEFVEEVRDGVLRAR